MIGLRTAVSSSPTRSSNKSSKSNVTTTPAYVTGDAAAAAVVGSPPLRTLDDVRDQISQEIAINSITKAEYIDGVRIGVRFVISSGNAEEFLRQIAAKIRHHLTISSL